MPDWAYSINSNPPLRALFSENPPFLSILVNFIPRSVEKLPEFRISQRIFFEFRRSANPDAPHIGHHITVLL